MESIEDWFGVCVITPQSYGIRLLRSWRYEVLFGRKRASELCLLALCLLMSTGQAGCSSCAGQEDMESSMLTSERHVQTSVGKPRQKRWQGVARGVAWDADWSDRDSWYGTRKAKSQLDKLRTLNVDWIAVTPFAFQESVHRPELKFRPDWGKGLSQDIRQAHFRGMKVMVKPHIWSNQFWDGSNHWRGTISMESDEAWRVWFAGYTRWIVQAAAAAQAEGADAFCVGLEYLESSRAHSDRWRAVIREVRRVFDGPLLYAAHPLEVDLPFWDDLDAIGVNAYYVMSDTRRPDIKQMKARWSKEAVALSALSAKYGKPVVFTEVGYASVDGTSMAPFRWPNGEDVEDQEEQAQCYQALFDAATTWPWFGGMFIWKYKIGVPTNNPSERHYVFQGKAAEAVVRDGFGRVFVREVED